jgi:hypothetical protein
MDKREETSAGVSGCWKLYSTDNCTENIKKSMDKLQSVAFKGWL